AARPRSNSPAFTTTAAATLALAIGANTAMFSVLNAVLLRPLPYRAPEQLAMLWTEDPTQNLREGRSALWSVEQWRSQSQSFADMATFDSVSMTVAADDGAEQIVGASISPNLLPLLGIQPALGRSFSADEAEQQQRLVLISHRFWQSRFGGSHGALAAWPPGRRRSGHLVRRGATSTGRNLRPGPGGDEHSRSPPQRSIACKREEPRHHRRPVDPLYGCTAIAIGAVDTRWRRLLRGT